MKSITINAEIEYQVTFPKSWRDEIASLIQSHKSLIVTTAFLQDTFQLVQNFPSAHFFLLPEGEEAKSIAQLDRGLDVLGELGLDRQSIIIAIGGGSVTDYAGFLASIWLRGIAWIAVPTTMAGMVDAAIGGKTAINSRFGKNLIGSFYSPRETIISPEFLSTLSERDLNAGLAEVIKTGFIGDREILNILDDFTFIGFKDGLNKVMEAALNQLIWRSVKVKADIVSKDFREEGAREFLNYGHTLGHAIEKHSKYSIRHGEAVSIGLAFAASLAVEIGRLDQQISKRHIQLLEKFSLPVRYSGVDFDEITPFLLRDKKIKGSLLRFVLLSDVEEPFMIDNLSLEQLGSLYQRIIR
jgi:3-dehydroquinate synthase